MLMRECFPFYASDGFECKLERVRAAHGTSPRGPVVLVHGAGVRSTIFEPPVEMTLVRYLAEAGYDVWLENWRASIDFPPSQWTLDQAAAYDHPAAVRKIIDVTGASTVKAVIHCQGSTSFMLSAAAGLLPQVNVIVSNAVSLHPIIPRISKFKIVCCTPLLGCLTPDLNPQWAIEPKTYVQKALVGLVRLTHHECDNDVCKFTSFTYGTGFPVLWRHENLNAVTHEWIRHEFASVPISFFKQMSRSVRAGQLVGVSHLSTLPKYIAAQPAKTQARMVFLTGDKNVCFLPESQMRTYLFFNEQRRNFHSFHLLAGYGHLDVFIGQRAAVDVFPIILDELNRPTH